MPCNDDEFVDATTRPQDHIRHSHTRPATALMLVLRVDLLLALQVVERREQGATLAVGGLETATAVWVDARDLNGLRKGVGVPCQDTARESGEISAFPLFIH